jgi:hypothetical protein
MSPAESLSGHLFSRTLSLSCEIGIVRSGVKGPLTCGSSSVRFLRYQ